MEKIGSQHFVEEEEEDSFRLNPSISAWLYCYTLGHNSIPEWSQEILCKVPKPVMRRCKLLLFYSVTFTLGHLGVKMEQTIDKSNITIF